MDCSSGGRESDVNTHAINLLIGREGPPTPAKSNVPTVLIKVMFPDQQMNPLFSVTPHATRLFLTHRKSICVLVIESFCPSKHPGGLLPSILWLCRLQHMASKAAMLWQKQEKHGGTLWFLRVSPRSGVCHSCPHSMT